MRNARFRLALVVLVALGGCAGSADLRAIGPDVILPVPLSAQLREGGFVVRDGAVIAVPPGDAGALRTARYLADLSARTRGLQLSVREGASGDIVFARRSDGPAEGYRLDVSGDGVTVSAGADAGLFYGATTLWQLLSAEEGQADAVSLRAMSVEDAPRFAWRGLMLDSARHFQSPEYVKRLIDVMALHKLNVLHWHLTDDQAWRLEIKKYPRLTDLAAWRVPAGQAPAADIDPATGRPRLYGGFYTQDQVREIVAHAAARNVTIVPEIEMPGHATAPLTAYPRFAVDGKAPTTGMSDWGVYPNLYNVEEPTFGFLEDVLSEVIELFPGPYVHVGGDEAVKDQWKASASVQTRMRELGVKDEHALQSYFITRMEAFLNARGKRLIGWDEILDGGVAPGATVMSWRGLDGALAAARAGHDTVLSPAPTLYFDNRQSTSPNEPPGRGNLIDLKTVYGFEPMPPELEQSQQQHVLGLQGNLWTEHVRTEPRADYMFFPRASAIAELGWSSPATRSWTAFTQRLLPQMGRYRLLGVGAADAAFEPRFTETFDPAANAVAVSLHTEAPAGQVRYTLDGSRPTPRSPVYADTLTVPLPGRLRAATFDAERPLSAVVERIYDPMSVRRREDHELTPCSTGVLLNVEDDAPIGGEREAFLLDIMKPCWIWPNADLTGVTAISAAVGQVPFNYQIGADLQKITFRAPATPAGELEVRLGCEGERIAVLPLGPAVANPAVTALPAAAIAPGQGRHDLCITYTAKGVEPLWALDWIQLIPAS